MERPAYASAARIAAGSLAVIACLAVLAACAPDLGGPSGAAIGFQFGTPGAEARGLTGRALPTPTIGDSGASGLTHLKYYIWQIVLMQDLTPTGSGFSDQTGPLYLYTAGAPEVSYEDFGPTEAAADTTHYVDLLDPLDRQRLAGSVPLDSSMVGTYRYATIQWMKPIKVTAAVDMGPDGSGGTLTFYTHPGTYNEATGDTEVAAPDLRSGPAEESIVVLNNGGFYFKLQEPLEITQADIDSQAQFLVTLNFDPEGFAQGRTGGEAVASGGHIRDASDTDQIYIPYLDLIPIAHRADQVIEREKYLIHVAEDIWLAPDTYPSECDLRLSIFSVQGDPDRSIVGLELRGLIEPGAQATAQPYDTVPFMRFATPFAMEFPADGTLTLKDWEGSTILSGFRRLTEPGASPYTVDVVRPAGPIAFPYELVSLEATGL